jgi:hypothetical protein
MKTATGSIDMKPGSIDMKLYEFEYSLPDGAQSPESDSARRRSDSRAA